MLQKHWPHVKQYEDIKELNYERLKADGLLPIDIITGGYPCQPFSVAGRKKGEDDPRHLWPKYFRLVKELRPTWVIGENVSGHIKLGLDTVISDLESEDYAVRPFSISASSIGANHQRERVWIVANSRRPRGPWSELREENENETRKENANQFERSSSTSQSNVADSNTRLSNGKKKEIRTRGQTSDISSARRRKEKMADSDSERLQGLRQHTSMEGKPREKDFTEGSLQEEHGAEMADSDSQRGRSGETDWENAKDAWESSRCPIAGWWDIEPNVGRVAHGVPKRVDRLKSLGNSVVPQIPFLIGLAIRRTIESE